MHLSLSASSIVLFLALARLHSAARAQACPPDCPTTSFDANVPTSACRTRLYVMTVYTYITRLSTTTDVLYTTTVTTAPCTSPVETVTSTTTASTTALTTATVYDYILKPVEDCSQCVRQHHHGGRCCQHRHGDNERAIFEYYPDGMMEEAQPDQPARSTGTDRVLYQSYPEPEEPTRRRGHQDADGFGFQYDPDRVAGEPAGGQAIYERHPGTDAFRCGQGRNRVVYEHYPEGTKLGRLGDSAQSPSCDHHHRRHGKRGLTIYELYPKEGAGRLRGHRSNRLHRRSRRHRPKTGGGLSVFGYSPERSGEDGDDGQRRYEIYRQPALSPPEPDGHMDSGIIYEPGPQQGGAGHGYRDIPRPRSEEQEEDKRTVYESFPDANGQLQQHWRGRSGSRVVYELSPEQVNGAEHVHGNGQHQDAGYISHDQYLGPRGQMHRKNCERLGGVCARDGHSLSGQCVCSLNDNHPLRMLARGDVRTKLTAQSRAGKVCSHNGYHVYRQPVPSYNKAAACSASGLSPASLSSSSFVTARQVMEHCGAGSAWIGAWNGDDYSGAPGGLAFSMIDGGGVVNWHPDADELRSVLCH